MALTQIRLSRQALDLSLTTAKIADLAVTTAKINDLAVTTAKIADLAVTTGKIADLNVTTGKIADLAVTAAKIDDLAVTTGKIADYATTIVKMSDLATTYISGVAVSVAAGTVRINNQVYTLSQAGHALTDNATNYGFIDSTGTYDQNTTGFPSSSVPLFIGVTAGGVVTSLVDKRTWLSTSTPEADMFVTREVPTGAIDSVNDTFALAFTPVAGSEEVYLNGVLLQSGGADYAITGASIVFVAGSIPQTGDRLLVTYRK